MDNLIHLCEELDESRQARIGGKGRGIHLLWKSGAKVPDSLCIPASMNLETAADAVLQYFKDDSGTREYAVRSSASIEDGQVKSYAGQFHSFLRIKGRQQLIEHCDMIRDLESPESRHIQSYAGKGLEEISMHIVVQEVVDADFSGVLFTCDPISGSRSHIVLEHVQGTAEHLMDGTATGERSIVHRDDRVKKGTAASSSQKAAIDRVIGEALELEEKLSGYYEGSPLDFEWVVKKGEILWLQVRPVTALRRKTTSHIAFIKEGEIPETREGETHWTSINAREAIPMVLTPLVCDMLVPFVGMGFAKLARIFGDRNEYHTAAVFDGRVFLNVTDLKKLTSHFPVKNPDALIESFLAGRSAERAGLKFSLSMIPLFLPLIWKDLNLGRYFDSYIRKEQQSWKYPDPAKLPGMSVDEMQSKLKQFRDISDGFFLHLLGSMRYMNVYSFLEDICKKHEMSASELIQGIGTPLYASSALHLRDLFLTLKNNEGLLFDDGGDVRGDWKERLETEPVLDGFRKEFRLFIEKFGHFGDGSMDIYLKNNREEPEKVLKLLAGIMKSGDIISSREYLQRLSAKRGKALQQLKAKMSFPEKVVFGIVIKLMHDSVHFRENIKFYFGRRADIFKVYLMELASRAVAQGVLDEKDDIFFLTIDEVVSLEIPASTDSLKKIIYERKQQFRKLQSLPYPLHRVEGPGGTSLYFPEKKEHCTTFKGAGASAGRAVGKARIILDLREADRMNPGEILVTTATSPSWTPLFSIAGAIVVEIGSMLSHGAVVAREIGIPAVIGIAGIVEALRDGDLLAVDGAGGTVEVLESNGSVSKCPISSSPP